MLRVMPLPLTVMLAVRLEGFVLAGAMTIIAPSYVPVEGDTVSQGASLLLTVQFVFEAMVITLCSPESFRFSEDCDSDRTGVRATASKRNQLTINILDCFVPRNDG